MVRAISRSELIAGVLAAATALFVGVGWRSWSSLNPVLLVLYYTTFRTALRPRQAPFCVGFALAGWMWFALSHLHPIQMMRNGVLPLDAWVEYMRRAVRFEPWALANSPVHAGEFLAMAAVAVASGTATHWLATKRLPAFSITPPAKAARAEEADTLSASPRG